jgi:hypothetical protein
VQISSSFDSQGSYQSNVHAPVLPEAAVETSCSLRSMPGPQMPLSDPAPAPTTDQDSSFNASSFIIPNLADLMTRRKEVQTSVVPIAPAAAPVHEPVHYPAYPGNEGTDLTVTTVSSSSSSGSFGLSSVPGPAAVTSTKPIGPKVTKVDSKIRSLMPAALRVKRPAENIEQLRQGKTAKLATSQHSTAQQPVGMDKSLGNVNDAYLDFMDEIDMLGATNKRMNE